MSEEVNQITEREYFSLSDQEKWNFIQSMKTIIEDLEVKANKNCEECEKNYPINYSF